MAAVEIVFSIIWTMLVRSLYQRLYPPRRMLVIYGNYPPDDLIAKINSRKDKYNICMSVSYKIGYVKLYTMAKEYEAVVLCDPACRGEKPDYEILLSGVDPPPMSHLRSQISF